MRCRGRGSLYLPRRLSLKKRVSIRVNQVRRTIDVDTQNLRRKTILMLEEIFEIASDYARGKIRRIVDEDGKERILKIPERQFWARIATNTALVIATIARGIDERQIDVDLDRLEQMLDEAKAKGEVAGAKEEAKPEEHAKPADGQSPIL